MNISGVTQGLFQALPTSGLYANGQGALGTANSATPNADSIASGANAGSGSSQVQQQMKLIENLMAELIKILAQELKSSSNASGNADDADDDASDAGANSGASPSAGNGSGSAPLPEASPATSTPAAPHLRSESSKSSANTSPSGWNTASPSQQSSTHASSNTATASTSPSTTTSSSSTSGGAKSSNTTASSSTTQSSTPTNSSTQASSSAEASTSGTTKSAATGPIGASEEGAQANDCGFLGAISALQSKGQGAQVASLVHSDGSGGYSVTFPGDPNHKTYNVSQQQLGNGSNPLFSSGDTTTRVLEVAANQWSEDHGHMALSDKVNSSNAMTLLTGDTTKAVYGSASTPGFTSGFQSAVASGKPVTVSINANALPSVMNIAGTNTINPNGGSHCVSVIGIDKANNTIQFNNPWDSGQTCSMPLDKFQNNMTDYHYVVDQNAGATTNAIQ